MKKIVSIVLALAFVLTAAACSSKDDGKSSTDKKFTVKMITDTGGVNDQSFNQSAWEGLEKVKNEGAEVGYLESVQESDYGPNLDKLSNGENDLVWGIGFMMADAIENAAKINTTQQYAIIDNAYEVVPSNMACVVFREQEPSFLVGYMAAKTTKTDKIGFVGGMKSDVIDHFEYGYRAGAEYAAKEMNKEIEILVQYADSFGDSAKGKAIATSMYTNGADIVFHAAGYTGVGVIEAAVEMNKLVIGVDRDQSDLAPDNMISSALKLVSEAIYIVTKDMMDGNKIGGKTLAYGLKEKAEGIPAYEGSTAKLVDKAVYDDTMSISDKIISGEIVPPDSESTYNTFKAGL